MTRSGLLFPIDADGKRYRWAFSKDGKYWMLRDHEGYVRTLEENWISSVPRIRAILENYGLTCEVS